MNKFNRVAIVSTLLIVCIFMVAIVSATTNDKANNANIINVPPSVDSNVHTQRVNDWQALKLFVECVISFQNFMPDQQIIIDTIVVDEENLVIFWSVS